MHDETHQFVQFRLRRRRYALSLSAVAGVREADRIRALPGASVAIGVSEWRGRLLTVLDLPRLLDDRPTSHARSLILLTPPLEELAFFVPAVVRLVRLATPDSGEGADPFCVIDPLRLLDTVGGVRPG